MRKLIVISPHPDDEILGAGGMLLKYRDMGWETVWLNVTDMKQEYGYEESKVAERSAQILEVRKELGITQFYNLGLKPASLTEYPTDELVEKISAIFRQELPEVVLLPYYADVHTDHGEVFKAAYACTKNFRYPSVKKVMCMEILSETDYAVAGDGFVPNCFVDISSYMDEKIRIMSLYKSEIQKAPFPRSEESIRALGTLRGSQAGSRYAEGFKLIKEIIG